MASVHVPRYASICVSIVCQASAKMLVARKIVRQKNAKTDARRYRIEWLSGNSIIRPSRHRKHHCPNDLRCLCRTNKNDSMNVNSCSMIQTFWNVCVRFVSMMARNYAEGLRQSVTSIVAHILATMTYVVVIAIAAIVCMVFLTLGLEALIETVMSPCWAYLIVAAVYVLVVALLRGFRRRLFYIPFRRYLARVIRQHL